MVDVALVRLGLAEAEFGRDRARRVADVDEAVGDGLTARARVAQADAGRKHRVRPLLGRLEAVEPREVVREEHPLGAVLAARQLVPAGDRSLARRPPVLAVARGRVRIPVRTARVRDGIDRRGALGGQHRGAHLGRGARRHLRPRLRLVGATGAAVVGLRRPAGPRTAGKCGGTDRCPSCSNEPAPRHASAVFAVF